MESDLHQIIVSPQQLTEDHVKVFIYQVLRGIAAVFVLFRTAGQRLLVYFLVSRSEVSAFCWDHPQVRRKGGHLVMDSCISDVLSPLTRGMLAI